MAMVCSRVCRLLLRLHVFPFALLIGAEFFVGWWTELTLEWVHRLPFGSDWTLRDVVGQHKNVGLALAYAAAATLALKLWMLIAKVVGVAGPLPLHGETETVADGLQTASSPMADPSLPPLCAATCAQPPRPFLRARSPTGLLIHYHWLLLVVLLPAQYLTTVQASATARLLGLEQGTVFAAHCQLYIPCAHSLSLPCSLTQLRPLLSLLCCRCGVLSLDRIVCSTDRRGAAGAEAVLPAQRDVPSTVDAPVEQERSGEMPP